MAPKIIQEAQIGATADETTGLLARSGPDATLPSQDEIVEQNIDYGTTSEASKSNSGSKAGSIATPNGETNDSEPQNQDDDDDRPLPMGQILILCITRMVDPVAFFCIFPFINQMIYDTGTVAQTDVGFYSGLIESLFSVCQMCTMLIWGRVSDRIGRKPVLIGSLIGCAVTVAMFGFAQTIPQMIIFRCLSGVCSGTVVTIRAMITELSTKQTQARAFSIFAFASNLGIFLGPIIGGSLSKLAQHYPSVFGGNRFLEAFPYALPTLVCGSFALVCSVVVTFFVVETLDTAERPDKGPKAKPMSTMEILRCKGVVFVLSIYSVVSLLGFAYTAVAPVYWFTPKEHGGFGLDERQISIFFSIAGGSQALWMLLVFPPLQRRVGTGGVLRITCTIYPLFLCLYPIMNAFLMHDWTTVFWVVGPIVMATGSAVAMQFISAQLALNDVCPSYQTLGTLNALALTLSSGIRAVAPALFTSIYAASLRLHLLWGQFIWVIVAAIIIALRFSLAWLPKEVDYIPAKKDAQDGREEEQPLLSDD